MASVSSSAAAQRHMLTELTFQPLIGEIKPLNGSLKQLFSMKHKGGTALFERLTSLGANSEKGSVLRLHAATAKD